MAEQPGEPPTPAPVPGEPDIPAASAWASSALVDYLDENLDAYTAEALEATLIAAGHAPADVQAALEQARARRTAAPVKRLARMTILVAYGLTYLVFVVGLVKADLGYGVSGLAAMVLTVVTAVALVASIKLIGRRGAPLTFVPLVALPLLILVTVAGACYATTGGAPLEYYQHLTGAVSPTPRFA